MQAHARACHAQGLRIGFVPTMGYLHDGHLSLIKIALASCDLVVVSIFVNPTQFSVGEDLDRYPQDMSGDLAKIARAGAHVVFTPSVQEIYDGEAPVQVSIPELSNRLCGQSRPHHFGGVCQVVLKLFGAVRCDVAVFGEKDFQQLAIIRRLAKDLYLDIEIKSGPDPVLGLETIWLDQKGGILETVHVHDGEAWKLDWEAFGPYSTSPWVLFVSGTERSEGTFRLYMRKMKSLDDSKRFFVK